ncbi:MAG TPA: hypothetical protein VGI63_08910 [Verrucomicrobiae bacterium]|jgi:hypothetical protein
MSAIANFENETSEVSRTCQILILCEDFDAYERAADVCWRILVQLADDLDFSFKCWNFIELTDPACAQSVFKAASSSDVILLSLHSADLPPVAAEWLDAFAGHRFRAEGVLALVLNEPSGSPTAVNKLVARLEQSARQMGMDFLSLVPPPEDKALQPAGVPIFAPMGEFPDHRNNDHWGLNE